ncbi:MAG: polyamine aminopropyltransferase [Firmicutes bacterium]|jgi:spermidine synthase|nr:polyamine aminopropyltransferase [Bacillota bacterium]NLL87406.1 polyamine aminopropyltransferase [Bacillota bacterium]
MWFTEDYTPNVKFSIKIREKLVDLKSQYQTIAVYDTHDFGRVLVIDGYLMLTEKDEFIYHEMITHVSMAVNPSIKDVLVVGAGDGGTVRELTRYQTIERIDMVEIDRQVVEVCRKYLPQTAGKLDDPRVRLFFMDGVQFAADKAGEYDLIIVDSTDPLGPGEGLFTRSFYADCHRALKDQGILANQIGGPYYPDDIQAVQNAYRKIKSVFPVARVYQANIPTYASGHWLFGFASKGLDPVQDLKADVWNSLGLHTQYYNTKLHLGGFALPNYVKQLLEAGE